MPEESPNKAVYDELAKKPSSPPDAFDRMVVDSYFHPERLKDPKDQEEHEWSDFTECDNCGVSHDESDMVFGPNPRQRAVHGDETEVWLCGPCLLLLAEFI